MKIHIFAVLNRLYMTKEEKKEMFRPHKWDLYENGEYKDTFPSHAAAKKAKHFLTKEAYENWLDLTYTIKKRK